MIVNYRDVDLMRILSREIIDDMFKLTFTEAAVVVATVVMMESSLCVADL